MELSGKAIVGAFIFTVETKDNEPTNPPTISIQDINGMNILAMTFQTNGTIDILSKLPVNRVDDNNG